MAKKRQKRQEEILKALNAAFAKSASIGRTVVNGTAEAVKALKLTDVLDKEDTDFLRANGYLVDEERIRKRGKILFRLVEKYPTKPEDLYKS